MASHSRLDPSSVKVARITTWSPSGPPGQTYAALTIVNWDVQAPDTIFGQVRNDTTQILKDSRVVVYPTFCKLSGSGRYCNWQDATLTATTLQPGEAAGFRLEGCPYLTGGFSLVGQGRFEP